MVTLCVRRLVALSGTRWALIVSLGVAVVCLSMAIGFGSAARNGALGALVGVYGFLLSGLAVEIAALGMNRNKGLAVLLLGYLGRVAALGGFLWWLTSAGLVIDQAWLGWGTLAVVIGWLAGLMVAQRRVRVPIYDADGQKPSGDECEQI